MLTIIRRTMMSDFAHLKDPKIDFIDRNRELILALIEKLFNDKVLGRREWEVSDRDSYIALVSKSIGDSKQRVIKFEQTSATNEGFEKGLSITDIPYSIQCFLDDEDLNLAVLIKFGKYDERPRTRYEIELEEFRRNKREQAEMDKIQKVEAERKTAELAALQEFNEAREKFGHLLDKNVLIRRLELLTNLYWKDETEQAYLISFQSKKRLRAFKWKFKEIERDMTARFSVDKDTGLLTVSLNPFYSGILGHGIGETKHNLALQFVVYDKKVNSPDEIDAAIRDLYKKLLDNEKEAL